MKVQLVEITAYDPGTSSTVTLRYCTGTGYVTGPADTPANATYLPRVSNPGNFTRNIFSAGKTGGASQVGYGAVVLVNTDGGLDDLGDYAFGGRACTIKEVEHDAAYSTAVTLFVGTLEQAEWSMNNITLRLRDRQAELDKPFQVTKYAGSNALPAGVEGVEDIKGRPKPFLYGRCRNISPVCVNTSRQIWQVNDGPLDDITAVRDNGVELKRAVSGLYGIEKTISSSTTGMLYSAYGNGKALGVPNTTTALSLVDVSTDTVVLNPSTTSGHSARDVVFCPDNNYFYVLTFKSGTYVALTIIDSATNTKVKDVNIWLQSLGVGLSMDYCPDNGCLYILRAGGYLCPWNVSTETLGTGINLGMSSLVYGVVRYNPDKEVVYAAFGTSATTTDKKLCIVRISDDTITDTLLLHEQFYFPSGGHYDSATARLYLAVQRNEVLIFDCDQKNFAPALYCVVKSQGAHIDKDGLLWVSGTSGTTAFSQVVNPSTGRIIASNTDFNNSPRFAVLPSGNTSIYIALGAAWTVFDTSGTDLGDYSSQSDMETNEPDPGMFRVWPGGGMFRLGSTPAGTVTCDAQQGVAAADRTVAQLVQQVAEDRGGIASGDFTSGDITALDTANDAEVGFYASDETTVAAVLDALAGSVGAWWGFDALGKFRIARLEAPSGTSDIEVTADKGFQFQRIASSDEDKGIPAWKIIVNYDKNWTVQAESAVAGYVSQAVKNWLAREFRAEEDSTASVKTAHLLSPEITVDTLILDRTEAATEADRLQALYGTQRHFLQVKLPRDTQADLFKLINVTIARFGYDSGKLFRVIGIDRDFAKGKNMVTLWG